MASLTQDDRLELNWLCRLVLKERDTVRLIAVVEELRELTDRILLHREGKKLVEPTG